MIDGILSTYTDKEIRTEHTRRLHCRQTKRCPRCGQPLGSKPDCDLPALHQPKDRT